ncbi:MAG: hypothetical protein J1G01_04570 [Clostridiales bacterium]|nr:hypothetical protein [Clostridiales bacterium]
MVIFLNLDGSCKNVTPQKVYQGSNNVIDVTVVAPFPSTTALQIGFILPDGLYWQSPPDGARYAPMEFVEQDAVHDVSVWHFALPLSVTQQQGELQIAINAVTTVGNTTSYLCKQIIEESILPNLPSAPEPSVYELLQLYLARLDGRTANVANLVKSIQKVAPNAFTYTDNKGITSAPIVIEGGDAAPIPVNAASTIEIPEDAWQPVYSEQTVTGYNALITAAMHGQMRDGAAARDLWVSFSETDSEVIAGVYQGYTVSETGYITISVKQPVAMTVRVWNGKGLVDEVARDMVEQETARAEGTEKKLQEQIYELQNSGVDLLARKEIAEETERAEQAEQTLQNNIEAETSRAENAESDLRTQIATEASRATEAEQVLNSDIQGLREDINKESHFRGMFNSVEELKTAYPTATPNDYAWIAGGNIWIWENEKWTDSNKPVPSTAVPASDSTPLMDGDASPGTLSTYARGDHRHPSDTSKVSKSGDTMTGSLTAQGLYDGTNNRVFSPINKPTPEDIGLGNVANERQYSEDNPQPTAGVTMVTRSSNSLRTGAGWDTVNQIGFTPSLILINLRFAAGSNVDTSYIFPDETWNNGQTKNIYVGDVAVAVTRSGYIFINTNSIGGSYAITVSAIK